MRYSIMQFHKNEFCTSPNLSTRATRRPESVVCGSEKCTCTLRCELSGAGALLGNTTCAMGSTQTTCMCMSSILLYQRVQMHLSPERRCGRVHCGVDAAHFPRDHFVRRLEAVFALRRRQVGLHRVARQLHFEAHVLQLRVHMRSKRWQSSERRPYESLQLIQVWSAVWKQ